MFSGGNTNSRGMFLVSGYETNDAILIDLLASTNELDLPITAYSLSLVEYLGVHLCYL